MAHTCVLSDTTKPLKHDTRIAAVLDGIDLPGVLEGMLRKPSVAEWNLLKCGLQRWRVWRTEGVKIRTLLHFALTTFRLYPGA